MTGIELSIFDPMVCRWADMAIAEATAMAKAGDHYDFDAIAEEIGIPDDLREIVWAHLDDATDKWAGINWM